MKASLINFYTDIHANATYGNTSVKRYPYVVPYLKVLNPQRVVDFGCGQSELHRIVKQLTNIHVSRFDPAILELSVHEHEHYDFLINTDVLEHVPEDGLDEVLSSLKQRSARCLIIIDMRLAKQILPDGQNAHVTVKPAIWWEMKLKQHFPLVRQISMKPASRAAFVTFPLNSKQRFQVAALTFYYKLRRSLFKRFGMKNN